MADRAPTVDSRCMTSQARSRRPRRPVVVHLEELRLRNEQVVAQVAAAPIRHLPAELLEALQGSWGTPEELGLAPVRERHLRLVAG